MAFKRKTEDQLQKLTPEDRDQYGLDLAEAIKEERKEELEEFEEKLLEKIEATPSETIKKMAAEIEKLKNKSTHTILEINDKALENLVKQSLAPLTDGINKVEKFFREKAEGSSITLFSTKAASIMTSVNAINENSYPAEMIESVNMIDQVYKKRRGYDFIFDVADRITLNAMEEHTSWLEEGDEQGAFAIVAEGALKPLVSTALVRNYAKAKKVAGKTVITEEFAKFRQKAWSIIRTLLNDKIMRDYKALALVDFNAVAASYVGTTLDDTVVLPNDIDAIGAVAAQIMSLDFVPDVLVINPQDLWRLKLTKDTQNNYLYLSIPGPNGDTVLGFQTVVTTRQTLGSFTLAESKLFKIEEENITVRLGYGIEVTTGTVSATTVVTAVSSDFDNNRMRLIMELFYKPYLPTPYVGSVVKASFATVKAALLKP